jgi:hypothetical protein
MPHFMVRYTRRAPDAASTWPLPQTREVLCAENDAHARSMLGYADTNLPIFVSQTRSPVTTGRFCACQRIA